MKKIVTVTKQGQITIPAAMRRILEVEKSRELVLTLEDNKIVIEPTKNIYELKGSLADHPKVKEKIEGFKAKEMTDQEIIKAEEKGAQEGIAKEYKESLNQ